MNTTHHRLYTAVLVTMTALSVSTGCKTPATGAERGRELYGYCAQCHGDVGEGSTEFRVPAIAGMEQWYVESQLQKFRLGARGDHPDDLDGLRMRPMSRTLATDEEVTLVSAYVAAMPAEDPADTLEGGDPQRGAQLYAPCVACHGERGEGKREVNAPALTHASDWYLAAQLDKFKTGIRGADPLDATGAQMRPMAVALADEQAMLDVVAYMETFDE